MARIDYIVQKSDTGDKYQLIRRSPHIMLDSGMIYSQSVVAEYQSEQSAMTALEWKKQQNA